MLSPQFIYGSCLASRRQIILSWQHCTLASPNVRRNQQCHPSGAHHQGKLCHCSCSTSLPTKQQCRHKAFITFGESGGYRNARVVRFFTKSKGVLLIYLCFTWKVCGPGNKKFSSPRPPIDGSLAAGCWAPRAGFPCTPSAFRKLSLNGSDPLMTTFFLLLSIALQI